MKIIDDLSRCVGCALCSSVCPQKCIEMEKKEIGFLYPKINKDLCIGCGKCKNACPLNKTNIINQTDSCYALLDKDEFSRVKSASGGASNVFANHILKNDGVFCGCRLNEELEAIHDIADVSDDLEQYRDSKYVQSNMTHTWEKIDKVLNENKTLLFTGTPCQAAAVRSKYGTRDDLYICDFICSGVPDPAIFKLYLAKIGKNEGKKINKFYFRDKSCGWKKSAIRIVFDDGTEKKIPRKDSMYYSLFGNNLFFRQSCYKCEFKQFKTHSDLTIGDWWGIEKFRADIDDDKGCSLVIINTPKGAELLEHVKDDVVLVDTPIEFAIQTHPKIMKSINSNPYRTLFYKMFNGDIDSLNKAYERCIGDSITDKIKRKLYLYFNIKK